MLSIAHLQDIMDIRYFESISVPFTKMWLFFCISSVCFICKNSAGGDDKREGDPMSSLHAMHAHVFNYFYLAKCFKNVSIKM